MINMEHATPELLTAYAEAQSEVENAAKNASNTYFSSKYADLAECLNTVRPVFAGKGLSIIQSSAYDGNLLSVTTVVAHAKGGYISAVSSCGISKTDAQEVGKATTYLRRYGLAAMTGIAQEDTDGNEISGKKSEPAPIPFISKEQAAQVEELVKSTNADLPRFLKLFMIRNIADMRVTQFDNAIAMLGKKAKKAAAEKPATTEESNNDAQ